MIVRTFVAGVVIMSAVQTPTLAQKEYTDLLLQGGLFAGPTLHSASFTQLPGIPDCCVEYDGGSGFGFAAGLGIELDTRSSLFAGTIRVGANLMYQALPGTLSQEEVVGNIISGSTVTDGVVDHTIDLSYGIVALQPYVAVPLPVDGLMLNVGAVVGMPMSASFEQQQTLLEPSDPNYTFENGSRTRNQQSGDLPDKSALFAAVSAGLRYDLLISESLVLQPSITYQLGLTDIMSTTPWSINALFGGVSIQYRLPKAAPPPPPPPPVVVVEKVLDATLQIESPLPRTRSVEDTLFLEVVDVRHFDTIYQATPTIYFKQNSTEPVAGTTTTGVMQQQVLPALRRNIEARKGSRVTIESMTSRDEDPRLARERISWVLRSLEIDPNTTTVVTLKGDSVEHPELADEQRRVRILIDGRPEIVRVHATSDVYSIQSADLAAVHVLTCEAGPCTTSIRVSTPSRTIVENAAGPVVSFTLADDELFGSSRQVVVTAVAETKDANGKKLTRSAQKVVVAQTSSEVAQVYRVANGTIAPMNEVVIGYCDFDRSTLSSIDESAIAEVRAALKRGARITIIPSTDGFGSSDYNEKLQRRRATEAMNVIGVLSSQVDIELTPVPTYIATTPMERVEQRSVRVRIMEVRP